MLEHLQLEYDLNEKDYLTNELFFTSKSEVFKSQLKNEKVWVLITPIILALLFVLWEQFMAAFLMFIGGISVFFSFKSSKSKSVKKELNKFILKTYNNRFGIKSLIQLNKDAIYTSAKTGNSKTPLNQIDCIFEITDYIFIKLQTGENLIIPTYKINNLTQLRTFLTHLSNKLNVPYTKDFNWTWSSK